MLINRTPSKILNNKVPFELLFPKKTLFPLPLRTFGCTCYVLDDRPHLTKLDPRSLKCLFLGYSKVSKGYKCFSPELGRVIVSRSVTFDESQPFQYPVEQSPPLHDDDHTFIYALEPEQVQSVDTPPVSNTPIIEDSTSEMPKEEAPIAVRRAYRSCRDRPLFVQSYDGLSAGLKRPLLQI